MVVTSITVKASLKLLILTTGFFEEMMANFDINIHIIVREKLFSPCKIDRVPSGVRLISNNAGRAPCNVVRCRSSIG